MLKDITTIKLQGAIFREAQPLHLLFQNGKAVKASLIYGRNGSGKSTIARSFKKLKGENEPSIQSVSAIDIHNATETLSQDEQDHIFIFDEDFVNKNVRVQEDGLGSIVMLGEQADLADLIAAAANDLHTAEADMNRKKTVLDEYANAANESSPQYYIEKMKSALKGDRNWAARVRDIKGNVAKTGVSDDTYRNFIQLTPQKTRDELIVDFHSELKRLKAAQSGVSIITASIPILPNELSKFDIESGDALLKKVIEHPELSEREQYLLGIVQSGEGEALRATAHEFASPALDRCPKCYQPLSEQYKNELIASIEKVLSEAVKQHQAQLHALQIPTLELDLSAFQQMEHYPECIARIESLNQIIQGNNNLLKIKEADPYTPIYKELTPLSDAISVLQTALHHLEIDRNEHNRTAADTMSIKERLTRINNEIAYYDVIELYRKYEQRAVEQERAEAEHAAAVGMVNAKDARLNELNAQRASIDIAIDVINNGLKYIFFSENRMQIQVDNGVYKLFSNGHAVKPKDVSVGERNIIGLCYFFTSILQGKNRAAAYNEEYLLIIDDPISSYDWENRVGILSYLKYQLEKFLLGNIETRAILMTHDLLTAIDVQKMFGELIAACKVKFNGQRNFSYASYELLKCEIGNFENKRNEYTALLTLIFEYGNGNANDRGAYIGNIMRQVMEAFATFEYKKGIDAVSTDDNILAVMEREEDRVHFKNLMYRIVLNEGSHRYDQARNMQMDFFAMISEPERRRTAKEILCFMYLLNKLHMRAHLGDQKCRIIDNWCEEIRGCVTE